MSDSDRSAGPNPSAGHSAEAHHWAPLDFSPLPVGLLVLAWIGLVVIGVLGRLWQPAMGVSPLIAIGLCAGALFPSRLLAATAPVAALAASNLALPGGGSYGSWAMAAVVYGSFAWPVLLGWMVRSRPLVGAIGGALAGSLVFFTVTNAAHWWLTNDYPHTLAGLVECYVAALPFYRWMPVGDVAWTVALYAPLVALSGVARKLRPLGVA
jgi:hypothetical protein